MRKNWAREPSIQVTVSIRSNKQGESRSISSATLLTMRCTIYLIVCALMYLTASLPPAVRGEDSSALPEPLARLKAAQRSLSLGKTTEVIEAGLKLVESAPLAVAEESARMLCRLGSDLNRWPVVEQASAAMLSRFARADSREWLWWSARALESRDRPQSFTRYLLLLQEKRRDEFLYRALTRLSLPGPWQEGRVEESDSLVVARGAMRLGNTKMALAWLSEDGSAPESTEAFDVWLKAGIRSGMASGKLVKAIEQRRGAVPGDMSDNIALSDDVVKMEITLLRKQGRIEEAYTRCRTLLEQDGLSLWAREELVWSLLSLDKKLSGKQSFLSEIQRCLVSFLRSSFRERLLWRLYDNLKNTGSDTEIREALHKLVDGIPESRSRRRALFLLGRMLPLQLKTPAVDGVSRELNEQPQTVMDASGTAIMSDLINRHPLTFYGLCARHYLVSHGIQVPGENADSLEKTVFPDERELFVTPGWDRNVSWEDIPVYPSSLQMKELLPGNNWDIVHSLYGAGRYDEAYLAFRLQDGTTEPDKHAVAGKVLASSADDGARAIKGHLRETKDSGVLATLYPRLSYPVVWWKTVQEAARSNDVDPFLVLSVMREESRFNPRLVSTASALGLMQIIPSTGHYVAGKMGMKGFDTEDLFDPVTNIRMGAYYLGYLLKRYKGNMAIALSAYNGGPGNAKRWKSRVKGTGAADYLEAVGYDETRYYVLKVMKSYLHYWSLYLGSSSR